jgi:molybdopterin-guanine dinucleotide biosynthesis protein A
MKSCIILCGGRSRRMGQDKGLMILDGKPLITHIMETLEGKGLVEEIIIVSRDEHQLNSYKKCINDHVLHLKDHEPQIRLITDLEKDQGPLVGLLTGLSFIRANGAIVLPCDSPFVSQYFIKNVFDMNFEINGDINEITNENNNKAINDNGFQAIVPKWPDGSVEPLHAYYSKKCIPVIQKVLNNGYRDVKSLLEKINVYYVGVELLDPEGNSFRNLNYPDDLRKNDEE